MATKIVVRDELIGEAVARQGGYEAVENNKKWEAIANGLGLPKLKAEGVKRRYEDMLRMSAELDEVEEEDEDEEFVVETILDSRTDEKGNVQYLVKWKMVDDGKDDGKGDEADEENTTWEPREHLACPELLQQFEDERKKRKQQQAADEAAEAGAADGAADASAADEAGGGSSSDAEPRTPAAGAPDAAAGSSPFLKVLRTCKPEEGKPLIFEVQLREGGTALVPSVRLRREVPLLLVDFYESRMAFPA